MTIRDFLHGFYHSFPVQLILLHLRKYQVLLVFWVILFTAIDGGFMSAYGADALFCAPEYLGEVNAFSGIIVGVSLGIFIMSWHITTFILHSQQFKFLATTSKPFLKYFINNSVLPILFLIFYSVRLIEFEHTRELMPILDIIVLLSGLLLGLIFLMFVSLVYFFGAEKTLMRRMEPVLQEPLRYSGQYGLGGRHVHHKGLIHVDWFFNTRFKLKRPREIAHYSAEFINTIFRRHHFTAVISIILAFLFLAMIGLFQDRPFFELPAASGILLLFSVLIAASGALVYWLKSWSFPILLLAFVFVDLMFRWDWIDPRNKAYGLDYGRPEQRPNYSTESLNELSSKAHVEADKAGMIRVLEKWKDRQPGSRPLLYIISVSGGGTRSSTFTFDVMRRLDSLMPGGLMPRTFLITGASGGMLGAAYFRELYRLGRQGRSVDVQDSVHTEAISKDLLNPLFSSMVTRDMFAPAQRFNVGPYRYIKDRAYSFEQQLNENTGGILNQRLGDYRADETDARIPMMILSSTVSSDARKMMISTQPLRFLMRGLADSMGKGEPDAIDFCTFFKDQDPFNLRFLSALRLNATFPYVLPNVWLPSNPVVDVMDAGIRDNYGLETAVRFLGVFSDWLRENTSGVVLIQIRDRKITDDADIPTQEDFTSLFTKPVSVIPLNWMKIQDYYQEELVGLSARHGDFPLVRLNFQYVSASRSKKAALNFHLTTREKLDIRQSLFSGQNDLNFRRAKAIAGYLIPDTTQVSGGQLR